MKVLLAVLSLALAGPALAYGPWLEKTPIGGVELSDGWTRSQLDARLDEIARENADRPFIVTRTKWQTTVFDHVPAAGMSAGTTSPRPNRTSSSLVRRQSRSDAAPKALNLRLKG